MDLTRLRALGRMVAAEEDALLAASDPDESLRVRIAQRAADRSKRGHKRGWLHAAVAAAAVVAMIVAAIGRTKPLTFSVGTPARPGVVSEWVSAHEDAELPVVFSDGTRVTLAPRARGRVVRLAPNGAEFVIESGSAMIAVVPSEKGDFRFRTGPFVVHVHGTRFSLTWDAVRDAFSLSLYEGHVSVSGCAFGAGRAVAPGETVRASCGLPKASATAVPSPAASSVVDGAPSENSTASSAPVMATRTSAPTQPSPPVPPVTTAAPVVADPPESWISLAQQGLYERAYGTLGADEFAKAIETANARETLLLGDVARHVGRGGEARAAYEAVRRRFAGSDQAANAAFSLGRLAFDANHDLPTAARWFDEYLAERPLGPLSAAALGRLLEARTGLGQRDAALAVARRYLSLYPNGPLANEARKVEGSEP